MPTLGNSNQINVLVKTTADSSGAKQAASEISKVEAVARKSTGSLSRMSGAVAVGEAAYAALSSTLGKVENFMVSSIDSANRYQSALIGLSSVSQHLGVDQQAATNAARQLASDGLMTVADAATGLKNLLAAHFGLDEAVSIMNRFKDSAAFGRQAALGFGESIRGATEGIKNGNSILVDNAGVTKNLSVMLEEAGYSQQDLMKASTDAGVRQAIYNGIMRETTAQVGDAAKLTNTFAGEQARAAAQVETLKQTVGTLEQAVGQGLLSSFTSFIGTNQRTIISFGAASIAAVGLAGGLFIAAKAIQGFLLQSIIAAASNPLILALTALGVLAGVVVYKAVDKMQGKLSSSNKQMSALGNTLGNAVPAQGAKASKAMEDLAKKLADIDDQAAKSERDFKESLAEMIKSHQDKVNDLKSQLADENSSYDQSAQRQADDFKATQQDMTDEHQKRVDDIQRQLNNEVALGKWADQQKIRDLQEQLAEENAEYTKQAADKQLSYEQDVADNKAAHDKKLADLQTQLDGENSLLAQHAADVAAIRNVTLLDEIDKLKRSHDEQLIAFQKQRDDAIASAQQTADGVSGVWNNANAGLNQQFSDLGSTMGTQMGQAFKQALGQAFKDVWNAVKNKSLDFGDKLADNNQFFKFFQEIGYSLGPSPRAAGGPVTAGQPYLVGDNPDGSINRTTELFVPRQSGTIIPAKQTATLLGGAGGRGAVTINQTNNNYTMFDQTQANRELGWMLSMKAAA